MNTVSHLLNMPTIWEAIRTGTLVGILAVATRLFLDNRKLKMAAEKRAQEYRLEVTADGRTNLQFIIDNLRRDIERADGKAAAAEAAHAACETELDQMRNDGRRTRDRLDGLARQFVAFADSVATSIPPGTWSPEMSHMMNQLAELGRVSRETLLPPKTP